MSCLGNIIWFVFGGLVAGLQWFLIGLLWCITIVGIPVGIQCFKLAKLQFAPFGKEVITTNDSSMGFFLNILWVIFGGLLLAITNIISAFLLSITIIGIPFAAQSLKMAKLSLAPFGKDVI
ncbi:YccF domain-containing protein [Clostridium sp. UBA7791]|uniref:YccF domain-containing protein n=1 Tax=Clostridium sp. UBA7791 TaxID=1946379 RepID=UPI003216C5A6